MFAGLDLQEGAAAKSLTTPCVLNAVEVDLQGVVGEITVLARRTGARRVAVELRTALLRNSADGSRVELLPADQRVSSKEFSDASLWVHVEAPVSVVRSGRTERCTGVFTLTEATDGTFSAKMTIRAPRDAAGKWTL